MSVRSGFGVFAPGTAEAVFCTKLGEELAHEIIEAVDPREVFRLEKTVPLPHGTFRISLVIRDADGENRGFLGGMVLDKHWSRPTHVWEGISLWSLGTRRNKDPPVAGGSL